MDSIQEYLAKNLRYHRKLKKFTQESLAELADVALLTIQRIENKQSWISLDTLTAIAKALKIKETDLFKAPDEKPDLQKAWIVLTESLGIKLTNHTAHELTAQLPAHFSTETKSELSNKSTDDRNFFKELAKNPNDKLLKVIRQNIESSAAYQESKAKKSK